MKSKIIIVIVFIAAIILLWRFALPIEKVTKQLPSAVENFATSTVPTEVKNLQQQVFAPPPLKSMAQNPVEQNPSSQVLTDSGVLDWTNINRKDNGKLPALTENARLDQAAQNKLNDMFKQQYFEHVNPQGKGPSDIDNAVGYAYISIGENLAEGYFKNNQDLLQAWMNSPGHRANILNTKYTEIGVAVAQGMFDGQESWMAVQEFGRPASSCPGVDANLKSQINSLQTAVDGLQAQLTAAKTQMDDSSPQTQADYDAYNEQVAQYNSLINIYNNKVDSLKLATSEYNSEVTAYNSCLAS